MPNDLDKIVGGVIEMGVDTFTPDFTAGLVLSSNSRNIMTGMNQGTAPRYGISPLPGHNVSAAPSDSGGGFGGLMFAESSINRRKFLFVLPIKLNKYDNLQAVGDYLLWLLTNTSNVLFPALNIELGVLAPYAGQKLYKSRLESGLTPTVPYGPTHSFASILNRKTNSSITSGWTNLQYVNNFLTIDSSINYCSAIAVSISGKKIPNKWLIGKKIANGTAATTATANMLQIGSLQSYQAVPSCWQVGNFPQTTRTLKFYNINADWTLGRNFIYSDYQVSSGTFIASLNQDYTVANYSVSGTPTSENNARGAAFVAANVTYVLVYDPECFTDSSYKLALFAAKGAKGFLMQEWERENDSPMQIAPLTDRFYKPRALQTLNDTSTIAGTYYTEMGDQKTTGFYTWPSYDGSTALAAFAAGGVGQGHILLGAAGSGVLRANTQYEFTYSIFDKQLGIETNVGTPVKFLTRNTDFVALSLANPYNGGVTQQTALVGLAGPPLDINFGKYNGSNYYMPYSNGLEIRFYYRPLGSYEWLPALFVDATDYFYNPSFGVRWACQGNVAGLPGGQPGGFIDYSFLPDDKYDCVVNFKGRIFWLSPKNMVFSLQNNPFAYPLRNSVPAPIGGFKGAIIHTYRGQSEQEARLVIFGQRETYIGKFSGALQQAPVAVSPSVTATFDVDGSDFTVDSWTSITAFSYRSAVVADGVLYWWGPQGVYRDDGVNVPTKISRTIEPDVFSLYEPTLTDEIHAIYDEKTHTIIWFYPPATGNTLTSILTYGIESEEFQFEDLPCKVDWASRVNCGVISPSHQSGDIRTIIGARASSAGTTQRGYFFDSLNRSGDYTLGNELMCQKITTPTTGQRRLLFDNIAAVTTALGSVSVGDLIAIDQFQRYTTQATGDKMLAKVAAVNAAGYYLDILLPDGAVLPTVDYSGNQGDYWFPCYHRAANAAGLHGFTWTWESKYWMPRGPASNLFWLWLYFFFKYTTWKKTDPITMSVSYRTASGASMISDTVQFRDNSDANFQLFHALRTGNLNNTGQALKLKLSGIHIGEEWALQYLEAHVQEEKGNILKMYQG